MITAFVIMMMIFIEYLNIQTNKKWFEKFKNNNLLQILFGSILGIIPGCMGSFLRYH